MKRLFLISFFTLLLLPSLVFASWWNPLTWKIFKKKEVPQQTQVIVEPANKNIINPSVVPVKNETKKNSPIIDSSLSNNKKETPTKLEDELKVKNEQQVLITEQKKTEQTKVELEPETIKESLAIKHKVNEYINYNSVFNFNSISSNNSSEFIQEASQKTGVPVDLLIYVFEKNELPSGSCYLKDAKTGLISNGKFISKNILSSLNSIFFNLKLDPYKTAIFCDGTIGFGFHPQTWNKLVPQLNPWDSKDVIMSVAVYLKSTITSYEYSEGGLILDFSKICMEKDSLCYGYKSK